MAQVPWSRLGLVALLCAVLLTPGHLATPDAHLRLAQARNFVTNGSLAVPDGVGNPNHGNLAPGRQGKTYSVYNPGHILLLAPVYASASKLPAPFNLHPHYSAAFGASFLGLAAHFLSSLFLLALLLQIGRSPRTSLLIAALFAFASISLPSAADGYDHTFEALTIVLSLFFLADDNREKGKIRPGLAGLALSVGLLFRYTALLALPGLLLVARNHRARLRLLLGLVPGIAAVLFFNYYRFGSVIETGYPVAWQLSHGAGIGETGFDLMNIPGNLAGLLASPGKGLLWFCPVIALSVPAWTSFRRARPRIADGIAVTAALYLLFYAANFAWHGSVWSWGPRYIIPIIAPVFVAITFLPKDRFGVSLAVVAAFLSVAVQATAVSADHRRHLLKEYSQNPSGFEERLLYNPDSSPVVGQFESTGHVVQATVKGENYHPFIASGPWRSEARPASIPMMLGQSIDYNVVDLWWIRLPFFRLSRGTLLVSILIGALGSLGTLWLMGSIWRGIPET